MSNKILFRVDSGNHIGVGHLMRCITLAEHFYDYGFEIYFITKDHLGHFADVIPKKFTVFIFEGGLKTKLNEIEMSNYTNWLGTDWETDLGRTNEIIESIGDIDIAVIDHYSLDVYYEEKLKARKIFVIDDLMNREHACHYLLDQNLTALLERYKKLNKIENAQYWLGKEFILLRKEFKLLKEKAIRQDLQRPINKILVFMGGSDLNRDTVKIINGLLCSNINLQVTVILNSKHIDYDQARTMTSNNSKYRLLSFCNNIGDEILDADLVIGAAGLSCYERIFLGCASVVISVAENQVLSAIKMNELGLVYYVGQSKSISERYWSNFFKNLDDYYNRIKLMREVCLNFFNKNKISNMMEYIIKDIQ